MGMFSVYGRTSWENPETASHGQLKPDLGFPHGCLVLAEHSLFPTCSPSSEGCARCRERGGRSGVCHKLLLHLFSVTEPGLDELSGP